jgi:hypothetical protein
MARIRTIKPEFWRHEMLSEAPEAVHMLAASLLNYADDEGYFNANPMLVKAECFPLREPSVSVHDGLTHLSNMGYIRLGAGEDGRRYGLIVTFSEHQRINRPTPSKIKRLRIVWEDSVSTHTQLSEDSHPERNREQGKEGKEGGADAQPEIPYRWSGKVIRLKEDDYAAWRKQYHQIPDFEAELQAADDYYAENPPKDGKWFFPVSNWLKKAHQQNPSAEAKEWEAIKREAERMRNLR